MKKINILIMNWWKTPRSAEEIIHERKVTHIELFYDILFSFLFAKYIANFALNISKATFIEFVILVGLTFFGWLSGVNYLERHGHDDLRTRVFAILQMLAVGGMVIYSKDNFSENYIPFFLFYSFLLLIQTYLDFIVRHLHSSTAILAARSMVEFIPLILIFTSLFCSPDVRFVLLVIVAFVDVFGPIGFSIRSTMFSKNVINDITVVTGSLVSRFSRFVMIILGNSVGALLNGVNYKTSTNKTYIGLLIGVLIIIGVWWIYFDHIPEKKPKDTVRWRVAWVNIHLLIVLSISGLAVGIIYFMMNLDYVTTYVGAFRISSISLIAYYLSLTLMFGTLNVDGHEKRKFLKIQGSLLICALVILFFTIFIFDIYLSIIVTVLMVLAPLMYSGILNLEDEESYGSYCKIEV